MSFEKGKRPEVAPGFAEFVQTATTTGTVISNRGISTLARKSSAGTSTQLYTLSAPTRAGINKTIIVTNATSSRSVRLTAAAGSGFLSTNANPSTGITKIQFKLREWGVFLVSISTKAWMVSSFSSRPPVLS